MNNDKISTLGNTKLVEQSKLKCLYITQQLSTHSENKRMTRHFTNACLYLPQSDYVLFSWLVYSSDLANVITYSTELLKMFQKATERAIEIYGVDKVCYNTNIRNTRKSFISLVEKGLLIKLTNKSQYMINPYMVYSHNDRVYSPRNGHKAYLKIVNEFNGEDLANELTKLCDNIQAVFEKELNRTNINLRKKNSSI